MTREREDPAMRRAVGKSWRESETWFEEQYLFISAEEWRGGQQAAFMRPVESAQHGRF